jgi:hypothetical protein
MIQYILLIFIYIVLGFLNIYSCHANSWVNNYLKSIEFFRNLILLKNILFYSLRQEINYLRFLLDLGYFHRIIFYLFQGI